MPRMVKKKREREGGREGEGEGGREIEREVMLSMLVKE